jgi:opacity protein-like surface antigen
MRVLTLLFFFVASLGLQAQDCEALKQQIDTQQADIDVLQTRMDEASEYDQKKAVAQEMRAVEGEIRLLKVEYRACMNESGEMGDPELLKRGLRQRAQGTLVSFAGAALVVVGTVSSGGILPLVYAGVGLGLVGTAQNISGSALVLKATKE